MKRHTKQRITGLLAVCLTFTAAVYGREGNPAAYRSGDRLCVRLPITAGIDLPANGQLTVTPVVSDGENQNTTGSRRFHGTHPGESQRTPGTALRHTGCYRRCFQQYGHPPQPEKFVGKCGSFRR